MNEDNVLLNDDSEESSNNSENIIEIDYQELEDAYYRALKRVETEKANREALEQALVEEDSDLVEFTSETDARFYSVGVVAPPTSSAEQRTAYLLDIRNILIIILFAWFLTTVYSKLKNLLMKYYTED